ncbi:MAG: tetratricopeptide repeat protein [Gemmatimonadales bacterium]
MAALTPELDELARRLADDPGSTCFAALADGMRKLGALDDAEQVARRGIAAHPGFIPGYLVLARVLRDRHDDTAAAAAAREAVARDGSHPLALEMAAELAGAVTAAHMAERAPALAPVAAGPRDETAVDAAEEGAALDDTFADGALDEPVVTESMAVLYRRQGHLDDALAVYEALVRRHPDDQALMQRRDAVHRETTAARPRAFDAAISGGTPLRAWLASIAGARAAQASPASSYDAFFQPAAPPPPDDRDLAAFQAWLRELDR